MLSRDKYFECIRDVFSDETGVLATIEKDAKNNGVESTLLCVTNGRIGMRVELDCFYDSNDSISKAVDQLTESYEKSKKEYVNLEGFVDRLSKPFILENVRLRLVNSERNKRFESERPWFRYLNFDVFYYVDFETKYSTVATNRMLEEYQVSADELHEAAMRNLDACEYVIFDVGRDMFGYSGGLLYCLTVPSLMYGASMIMRKKALEDVYRKIGSDFYILPSSVHEVLCLRKDHYNLSNIKEMVYQVNRSVVENIDYLSDDIYWYDHVTGEVQSA